MNAHVQFQVGDQNLSFPNIDLHFPYVFFNTNITVEILDMFCSFFKAEDILMLQEALPIVRHCPRCKRLVNKTNQLNQLWFEIGEYRCLHENCIHVCLPQITLAV